MAAGIIGKQRHCNTNICVGGGFTKALKLLMEMEFLSTGSRQPVVLRMSCHILPETEYDKTPVALRVV